jgi:hypothetical protein
MSSVVGTQVDYGYGQLIALPESLAFIEEALLGWRVHDRTAEVEARTAALRDEFNEPGQRVEGPTDGGNLMLFVYWTNPGGHFENFARVAVAIAPRVVSGKIALGSRWKCDLYEFESGRVARFDGKVTVEGDGELLA